MMKAMLLTGHGGLDKLVYRDDVPVPAPAVGEVLVRVHASSVNNTDINTRTSWYAEEVTSGITADGAVKGFVDAEGQSAGWSGRALSFPRIQGADICGEIVAVGPGVPENRIGERILADVWIRDGDDPLSIEKAACIGSEINGGFAEYATIPQSCAYPITSQMSATELASFPCAYTTAENLVARPSVSEGDLVLITGASGGVGSAATQLCKRRGARVIAMASVQKHEDILALGADGCLARKVGDLKGALTSLGFAKGVDVVLDPVCGPSFGQLVGALKPRGRYASCGAIAGPIVTFDARDLIYSDLEFYGATVAPKSVFEDLMGYIERGEIRPVVAKAFDLPDLAAAQEEFARKTYVGKIAIRVTA